MIRLGAPVYGQFESPTAWAEAVVAKGYRAAYCPVGLDADVVTVDAYRQAAEAHDLVIAEVGAWCNPLSADAGEAQAAMDRCKAALVLADRIGAPCAVNIAGACGPRWDGPHPDNLSEETFDRIVAQTREIIDSVAPTQAVFTLEPMPWIFPSSPDEYLRLIEAIDRPHFGAHLDPVNMINCPERYLKNGAFLRECFEKLGRHIRVIHAKDTLMDATLTVKIEECAPGKGTLDYRVFLQLAQDLDHEVPFLLEHLPTATEYDEAAAYVRRVGAEVGIWL